MAVFPQYVYRSCHCLYLFRFAYPTYGGKTEREYFPAIIRASFSFAQYTSIHCCRHFYRNATICCSRNERWCGLYRTDFSDRLQYLFVDIHFGDCRLCDSGRNERSDVYGCVAGGYHVRLYAFPAVLFVSGA